MSNNAKIHAQIVTMIEEIRLNIAQDISKGSTINDRYNEIKILLNTAEELLNAWDTGRALDIIWDINVDLLEQVDRFDDTMWEVIRHLKRIHERHTLLWKAIPNDIIQELNILKEILRKYQDID